MIVQQGVRSTGFVFSRRSGRALRPVWVLAFLAVGTIGGLVGLSNLMAVALVLSVMLSIASISQSSTESKAKTEAEMAMVFTVEGFSSLNESYGPGTSEHVYRLLRRAVLMETDGSKSRVRADDREIVILFDEAQMDASRLVMRNVERRFSLWLSDAGYECDLSLGLTESGDDGDSFRSVSRRFDQMPYLD